MSRSILILLALAGCLTPEPEPAAAPTLLAQPQASVPQPLSLSLSTGAALVGGEPTTFQIGGATASQTLFLLVTTTPGAPPACPPQSAPECLDIGGAIRNLRTLTADADGNASFTVTLPAALPAPALAFQVVALPSGGAIGSNVVTATFLTADSDTDFDGLTAQLEVRIGTDPLLADSDDDGLSDGDELGLYLTRPLLADTDGDGLSDGDEVLVWGSDPLAADTDADGLTDGDEIEIHFTDPTLADTDADGLTDDVEVLVTFTDPNNHDTDGDTLSDGEEVDVHGTDPHSAATDADTIPAPTEIFVNLTDPTLADTDADGLDDADELQVWLTDPLLDDTDGGGVIDGTEAMVGTDPLAPSDDLRPLVLDPHWVFGREIPLTAALGAHFDPVSGEIYAARGGASSAGGGLYRTVGRSTFLQLDSFAHAASAGVAPDGSAFVPEVNGGVLFRWTDLGGKQTWVTGWHSGDDDPAAVAFQPAGYTGTALAPGEAVMVDPGYNGADEVWIFSTLAPEGERVLHADNGTLVQAQDIAISADTIWLVDDRGAADGRIYSVDAAGALTELVTDQILPNPTGIAIDPLDSSLLVLDNQLEALFRVDPADGSTRELMRNLFAVGGAGVDISTDGLQLVITADDGVFTLDRCGAGAPLGDDCNANGISDICEIEDRSAADCDLSRTLDSCQIALGTVDDCDGNGVPDTCVDCPGVDVVFVMDTSSSMDDEGAALCNQISSVGNALAALGVNARTTLLSIDSTTRSIYSCLTDSVIDIYGTTVPGSPPPNNEILGACPGGSQVASEDWARAVSVTAANHPWRAGSVRVIVPIADEGPWCGDPSSDPGVDRDSIEHAILVAQSEGVIVSPITGTGSSSAVIGLAMDLADGTGGTARSTAAADVDLTRSLVDLSVEACATANDCDGDGTPDSCQIAAGTVDDCDLTGRPDACEIDEGTADDCNHNLVPDSCDVLAGVDLSVCDTGLP